MQEQLSELTDTLEIDTVEEEKPTAPQLTEIELRVLGVLMEKQLTTPDAYPLTLNSIITACNQKSSREPITSYQQGEVARTLQLLEDRNLVRRERGSRSDKYDQIFIQSLGLGKKQQALLCVMMLRGPQTLSELNTRTQRMCDFIDKEDLELCVEKLCTRETPVAIQLGQQPGQRGERTGHLFAGIPTVYPRAAQQSHPSSVTHSDEDKETIALLELEVSSLKESVEALKAESALLKQQINELYALTGHAK